MARDAVGNIVAEADRYVATDTAKIDTTAPIGKVTAVDIRLDNESSAGTAVTGGDGYINALEKGDLCCQQRRKTFGRFHQAA